MHWVDPRRYFPDFCRPNLYGMRCQPIAADFFRRARYRRHNRSAVTMRQWTRRKQKPSLFAWIPLFSTRISASSPIRMSLASSGTSANRRPDIVPQGFNHSAEAFQSKPLQSALFRRTVTDLYPTGNLPVLPYRSDFSLEGRRSIRASGGSPRGAADAPVLARGGVETGRPDCAAGCPLLAWPNEMPRQALHVKSGGGFDARSGRCAARRTPRRGLRIRSGECGGTGSRRFRCARSIRPWALFQTFAEYPTRACPIASATLRRCD